MFKEVFISHAKEDIDVAEELFDFLLANGYTPWLDKKKLKVGANWDLEIKKALKESTFVIALLSSTSVNKRGYIQREFKYALEYWETKLNDDIYIIPILLDKCEVPEQLSKFQWIEVDNLKYKEDILSSLEYQRQKYLSTLTPDLITLNDYTEISIDLKVDTKAVIDYSCSLPLFLKNNYFDAGFVNTFIQQKALEIISAMRGWIYEIKQFLETEKQQSYIDIGYGIRYISKDYLSLHITTESFLGGAHPNTSIDTLNFRFNPDRKISLRDLISYGDISTFLKGCIEKYGDDEQKESLLIYTDFITDDTLNFLFNQTTLDLDFTNNIPRVIMALGSISIPLNELNVRK